jgi:hypothetical protein
MVPEFEEQAASRPRRSGAPKRGDRRRIQHRMREKKTGDRPGGRPPLFKLI